MKNSNIDYINAPGDYFSRPEISNSDLSELKTMLMSPDELRDYRDAYRMGNLIDAMLTEPRKVDFIKRTNGPDEFTADEFEIAKQMKRSFLKDEFCRHLLEQSQGQVIFAGRVGLRHEDIDFSLMMRCKYDLWAESLGWGGDIKSTTATTQKQFEAAVDFFDYDRQRNVYMRLSDAPRDMLIGISKVNFKIFKVKITRGDAQLWKTGERKLSELAFKYFTLFENITS